MPNLRELRSRIRSIESTSRVTKALQMIAAAKMKKAQDKVLDGRAYSKKLNSIILSNKKFEFKSYFYKKNSLKEILKKIKEILTVKKSFKEFYDQ